MIDGITSPLRIIHFDSEHDWDNLLDLAAPRLDQKGLERLKRCLGDKVQAVLIEAQYIDKDYRNTFSHYHSRRFSTPDSRCIRLHFLDSHLTRVEIRDTRKLQKAYCGYAIIRPTRPNCIGRTLLNPRKLSYPKGYLCLCEETVYVQGTAIRSEGFPFISQDGDVTVCAQSALWMLLRFFSNRYSRYPEIYPHQITQLTRDYSIGRVMPSDGLTDWQMAEALRQMGLSPLIYSRAKFSSDADPEWFEHLLYTYIESGVPVLASTRDHVVVSFGHTSDRNKNVLGNPPLLRSSFFNSSFIVSDDNHVPYQRLRQARLPKPLVSCSEIVLDEIEAFTAPLSEGVFLAAEQFETLAKALLLQDGKLGVANCSQKLSSETIVTRVFLTTCRAFKVKVEERGMGHELVQNLYRNLPLPHFIWVCELSTVDLYRKGEVLGEIVWDATRNSKEQSGWLALHYPEKIFLNRGSALNSLPEEVDCDLQGSEPYPLMVHNLQHL